MGTHQQHPSHPHSFDENDNEGTFDLPLADTPLDLSNNFQMADTVGLPDPSSAIAAQMQLPIAQPSDGHPLTNLSPLAGLEGSRGSSRSTINTPLPQNTAMGLDSTLENAHPGFNDRPDYRRIVSTESVSRRSEKEEFQDIFSELMTGTEHEVAFLTRHYTEIIGPWYVSLPQHLGRCPLMVVSGLTCRILGNSSLSLFQSEPSTTQSSGTPSQR